uniref:(northern house mosquito) hypothetical protein n=1 Tax=Culex pipiens TaxID=7175 RepID=A0A8D8BUP7_CULPI
MRSCSSWFEMFSVKCEPTTPPPHLLSLLGPYTLQPSFDLTAMGSLGWPMRDSWGANKCRLSNPKSNLGLPRLSSTLRSPRCLNCFVRLDILNDGVGSFSSVTVRNAS